MNGNRTETVSECRLRLAKMDEQVFAELLREYKRQIKCVAYKKTGGLADEIQVLTQELTRYGIGFRDLVSTSSKSGKTRKACAQAIDCIVSDPELVNSMRKSRTLPAQKIRNLRGIPPKIRSMDRKNGPRGPETPVVTERLR